jgi:hypothetical protein
MTGEDYELLVPGPKTRAKVEGLLDNLARLSEEIAFCQRELSLAVPEGFGHKPESCCASPVIGYVAARLDPSDKESDVWAVHTATLKHPDGCCSLDYTGTKDEVERWAWDMAKANGLIWNSEASS